MNYFLAPSVKMVGYSLFFSAVSFVYSNTFRNFAAQMNNIKNQ